MARGIFVILFCQWRAKGADALLMADILGHANPSFTLDIYAHLFSDNLAEKLKVVQ